MYFSPENPLRIAVIGAGVRGTNLARQIVASGFPARIAAVAEPDDEKRESFAAEFSLGPGAIFTDWQELTGKYDDCDAALIATLDNLHTGPALECLKKNWHLLIEKPLADTYEGCLLINRQTEENQRVVAVCHTLRFMYAYRRVYELFRSGVIGKVINVEHMEAVGNSRFVHNYVRGRWSRESNNTYLILHKCCHDIDYLNWLIAEPCVRVSSSGSLKYFTIENAPPESAFRCIDCQLKNTCLYSATKLYTEGAPDAWPAKDISREHTRKAVKKAIKNGPYGICAWKCDNDVVDHQVVLMEFEGGTTATCTLTGFSATNGRRMRLQGTEGEMLFDEANSRITIKRFAEKEPEIIELPVADSYHPEDRDIVENWLAAVNGTAKVSVDTREASRTLAVVFAAEKSRKEKRVVELGEYPL